MSVFFFLLGLLQCCFLWFLGRAGQALNERAARQWRQIASLPPYGWPSLAVIVPVAGTHPAMQGALKSLAMQDYPGYSLILVTASCDDPANSIIDALMAEFGHVRHVAADYARSCGQKNRNLLAGVAETDADIYAFCDSTHIAREDFLRCLVAPVASGQTDFSTGYHEVEPRDQGIVTLAYAISVMFMRFMQSLPGLAQPWGGAMAMSKKAFIRYDVAALWSANVVDDCSLGALMRRRGARLTLCPGALLRTWTVAHPLPIWRAWLERQILFLKFCMRGQWLGLGLVCVLMATPPLWCLAACGRGLMGLGGNTAPFLALCWLFCLWLVIGAWRNFLPRPPAISRWLYAFFSACFMFALVYCGTFFSNALLWHNTLYRVAPGGRVVSIERQ